MRKYAAEKLAARKASRELVVEIFRLTEKMPQKAKVTLGVELRKAATSLSSYVTEGSSRNEQEEQTDLLLLAYESLVEISNKLIIAKRLSVVHPKSFEILQLRIKDLAVKINKVAKPDEA